MASITQQGSSRGGLTLVVIAASLWGTLGIATRALYEVADTSAIAISFWRLALATPLLAICCLLVLGRRVLKMARRDLALSLLSGVPVVLSQLAYVAAVAEAGVSVATLITLCGAPPVAALGSALLLGERLTGRVLLAMLGALLGTGLLVLSPGEVGRASGTLLGSLLALVAAVSYALATLLQRKLLGRCHPLQVSITAAIAALAVIVLVALAARPALIFPPSGWLVMVYIVLVPTVIAYILLIYGLRTTPATVATIVSLLEAVVATILAHLIFGERLEPLGQLGALLLLGAIMVLYWRRAV